MENNLKIIPAKVFENSSVFKEHKFIQPYNKNNISTLYVEILLQDERAFVILSELPENEGCSVTNGIEYMATQVYHKYLSEYFPEQIMWFEHYPATAYRTEGHKETYAQVFLSWHQEAKDFYSPQWKHIKSIDDLRNLVNNLNGLLP